ncbi:MAG TPA: hypothetical protein VKE91_12530 [Blastocatellia bacterium]|nr:hypothetical protein [Blastocatellia bacterium]
MNKVLLPGILGGLLVFIWSAFAHMVLPIGQMGLKGIPNNEGPVLDAMKSNIQRPGIYFMPGIDMSRKPTDAELNALYAKAEAGPTAFLVYHPTGAKAMTPGQLIRQALFNIVCGLIAAFIISATVASLTTRAVMITLMGLFAWVEVNLPYWNWYRFPADFTFGAGLDIVIGWLLGGFLIAWLIQRAEKKAAV